MEEINFDAVRHNKIVTALYEVKDWLTNKHGYNVLAIYLQGSQNYGLDTERSDIDMKAFIMPSPLNLYEGTKLSTTYETKYGQVEVKDIRLFEDLLVKGNPTYLELLNTRYSIVDKRLEASLNDSLLDDIVMYNYGTFLKALQGTAFQKYESVFKATPSTMPLIETYGYRPKELHHLARLRYIAEQVIVHKRKLSNVIMVDQPDRAFLIDIKLGKFTSNEAQLMAKSYIEDINKLVIPKLVECSDEPVVIRAKISSVLRNVFLEEIKKFV